MEWKEAEKVVMDKYEDLQTKLNLLTSHDIHGHYEEVMFEFKKKLGEVKRACCFANIRLLLRDYGDSMPR